MTIFLNVIPFFIFSNSDHVGWRSGLPDTILEGITHGPFHQSLVFSGQVVLEENIPLVIVNGSTTDAK
jgi:hypothetical protein